MKNTILFLITGGTIDSFYDGTKDTVVPYENSVIPKYIQSLKLYDQTEFVQVCMKDSRAITANDRKQIAKTIEKSACTKVIITHGTYTMPDTAKYLKTNLTRQDQTIVLTAAMVPHEIMNSDAPFNLGYAFSEIHHLPAGIYICMNGRVFTADEAAKDIAQGRFVSIFSKKS